MSDHQVSVLAGIFMILVLGWTATFILKWLYNRTQQIKKSGVAEKVKYTAQKAISKSLEELSSAVKAGASLAKRVTKNDPSQRYDALH